MAEKGSRQGRAVRDEPRRKLSRLMEPRAAQPDKRWRRSGSYQKRAWPTSVMVAPIIPAINDHEVEAILAAAYAPARGGWHVMLRLPLELEDLSRNGCLRISASLPARPVARAWHARRQGVRFHMGQADDRRRPLCVGDGTPVRIAAARAGFNVQRRKLRTDPFTPPKRAGEQLKLF